MYNSLVSICLLACMLFVNHNVAAQKGHINLNAGITFDQERTPLAASVAYFFSDAFSVGIQGYRSQESTSMSTVVAGSTFSMSSKYVSTFIGLRGNFHFNTLLPEAYQRIDPFIGISVGKILLNENVNVNLGSFGGPTANQGSREYDGITLYAPIGVRYQISNTIGAYVEYNLGLANTTADVDQNGKLKKFYEKRQYQLSVGIGIRF